MKRLFFAYLIILILFLNVSLFAQTEESTSTFLEDTAEETVVSTEEEEEDEEILSVLTTRRETILYGINTEIITVIDDLSEENNMYLNPELMDLFRQTSDKTLQLALIKFFSLKEIEGVEDRAIEIVRDHDFFDDDLVVASIKYLGAMKSVEAIEVITSLLEINEDSIVLAVINALGVIGESSSDTKLIELLDDNGTEDDVRAQIILALGNMKSTSCYDILIEIIDDDSDDSTVRRYACDSLGKIGNPDAIPYLERVYSDGDTITRTYALSALAQFDGEHIINVLMQALRDAYWKVRIAAAKGLAEKKAEQAVDILIYKAKNDPELVVKKEAITSLSIIGNDKATQFVTEYFNDEDKSPSMRLFAIQTTLEENLNEETFVSIKNLILEEWDNETTYLLENTCKLISLTESDLLHDLSLQLLDHDNYLIKVYAIRTMRINNFRDLSGPLGEMINSNQHPLVKRTALSVFEEWDITPPDLEEDQTQEE